jgi:hypothetical protein
MKRTASTLALALALTILIAQTMLVNLSKANPTPQLDFPTDPVMTQPTIIVNSPLPNQGNRLNDLWLNFTIVKPDEWIQPGGQHSGTDANGNPYYDILVNVTRVYFVMDDGERQYIPVHDISHLQDAFPERVLNFSTRLTLAEGVHSVKVGFEAESFYRDTSVEPNSLVISSVPLNGISEVTSFTVVKPPVVDVISPVDQIYDETAVSLTFAVNKPVVWMGCSLDGGDNVTVTGNVTLSGLSSGSHNVTFYAKDSFGIVGTSETVYFSVEAPFPTTFVAAAIVASFVVIGVGLLVYIKKRKLKVDAA